VAVDDKGFYEVYGSCDIDEAVADNGGKCIPDDSIVVDMTDPIVSDISIDEVGQDKVSVSWDAQDDTSNAADGIASGLKETIIYRNGVKLASVAATSSTSYSYTDTSVDPNTKYSYYVVAVDKAGNESSYSDEVSVTTLAVEISPVSQVDTPIITNAVSGGSAAVEESSYQFTTVATGEVSGDQAEIKSDTTDGQDDEDTGDSSEDENSQEKSKTNIPLWG
jgi:fibronectin type 3 domain-containing protein